MHKPKKISKLFTLLNGCVQTNLILSHFCAAMGLESLSTPAKGKMWFLVEDMTLDISSFNSKNLKMPMFTKHPDSIDIGERFTFSWAHERWCNKKHLKTGTKNNKLTITNACAAGGYW